MRNVNRQSWQINFLTISRVKIVKLMTLDTPWYDIAFVVDTSGSMSGERIAMAQKAIRMFSDALLYYDKSCLIEFNSTANILARFDEPNYRINETSNSLIAGGNTNVAEGLSLAIDELEKLNSSNKQVIILICDGDVNNVTSLVETAITDEITIYTVNVQNGDSYWLNYIANSTNGYPYIATDIWDVIESINNIKNSTVSFPNQQDSDDDGVPDVFEINGIHCSNGVTITTNPNNPDTDGDGLNDGDELGIYKSVLHANQNECFSNIVFNPESSPITSDTDNDYYIDCFDKDEWNFNSMKIYDKYLNDSNSIGNQNPVLTETLYSDGSLSVCSLNNMDDENNLVKNVFTFERDKNHCVQFTISPEKASDYIVTISNISLSQYIEASKNNYQNLKISIFKNSKMTKNAYSKVIKSYYNSNDSSVSFKFDLDNKEGVKEYIIVITNEYADDKFMVNISQDNWEYVPNGCIRRNVYDPNNASIFNYHNYDEIYITNKTISELIEITGKRNYGEMWKYDKEFLINASTNRIDGFEDCTREILSNIAAESLNFNYKEKIETIDAFGNLLTVSGIILSFSGDGVTLLLDLLNATNLVISNDKNSEFNEFTNALIDGGYNIYIQSGTQQLEGGKGLPMNFTKYIAWSNIHYVNKYENGVRCNIFPFLE